MFPVKEDSFSKLKTATDKNKYLTRNIDIDERLIRSKCIENNGSFASQLGID